MGQLALAGVSRSIAADPHRHRDLLRLPLPQPLAEASLNSEPVPRTIAVNPYSRPEAGLFRDEPFPGHQTKTTVEGTNSPSPGTSGDFRDPGLPTPSAPESKNATELTPGRPARAGDSRYGQEGRSSR